MAQQTYNIEEVRKRFPRAYMPWTKNEEEELMSKYQEYLRFPRSQRKPFLDFIKEVSPNFQRDEGAVVARLTKLFNLETSQTISAKITKSSKYKTSQNSRKENSWLEKITNNQTAAIVIGAVVLAIIGFIVYRITGYKPF